MPQDKVHFELATPERLILSVDADMVVVPGREGDFGVLPRHAPLLSTIRPGIIDIYDKETITERIFVSDGFSDVIDSRCTVLANEAILLHEIDLATAAKRLKEAEQTLATAENEAEQKFAQNQVYAAEVLMAAISS